MIDVVFAAVLLWTSSAADPCAHDKAAILALSPDKFDQDLRGGWRPLGNTPGCEGAAADLIEAYRQAHWGALTRSDLHESYWHEGQLRAAAGQSDRAVPLLLAGVDPEGLGDPADYALGTVAFLQHDLESLKAARARIVAQPEPAWFKAGKAEAKRQTGREPTWPMYKDELDGFLRCFDKPYAEAYSSRACRTP